MKTIKKKFPIYAGMPLNNLSDTKIRKIGFRIVQFTYNEFEQLIDERTVKTVIL